MNGTIKFISETTHFNKTVRPGCIGRIKGNRQKIKASLREILMRQTKI
jgi:hypothetical protein